MGGRTAPLSLPVVGGGQADLDDCAARHRGVVVVFWAAACSHCFRYDGYLNTFAERFPEVGLLVVAARRSEGIDDIADARRSRGLGFQICHDASGSAAREWFVPHTPRAYLVDAARRLLYRGAIDNFKFPDDDDYQFYLDGAVTRFLAGEPIGVTETAGFGCAVDSVYYQLQRWE